MFLKQYRNKICRGFRVQQTDLIARLWSDEKFSAVRHPEYSTMHLITTFSLSPRIAKEYN